jgi:hypothetical protein
MFELPVRQIKFDKVINYSDHFHLLKLLKLMNED